MKVGKFLLHLARVADESHRLRSGAHRGHARRRRRGNCRRLAPLIKRLDKRFEYLKKVIEVTADAEIANEKNLTIVSLETYTCR
jgi:hypothetical protein